MSDSLSQGEPKSAGGVPSRPLGLPYFSERALVWIVDDSPLEAEMAKRALSARYDIEIFADGATMLERLASGVGPDTLVLDWQLPGMNGIEVCRFLRETSDEIALPVLMLTVQGHKEDVVEGLASGANDYVTKPYDLAELLARVDTLVRTKGLHERARRAEHACELERKRLRESERRLRMVAEAIPQIVWTASAQGVFEYFNQRWAEDTGVGVEQAQGEGWSAAVHPDDREASLARWRQSMATGDVYEMQLRLRRGSGGAYRWYLARALPLRDADGQITKWFGTFTDIDDGKRTEAQIEAILEGAPVGIGFLDPDLRYQRINEALADMHCAPKGANVGRTVREVLPDLAPEVERSFRRVVETGKPVSNVDVATRAADGSERHLLASYFPVSVGEQIVGLAVMAMDITKRKRAERALDLLARASTDLAATIDVTTRCETITRLVVPSLADVSGIYLRDQSGAMALVAGAHAKPEGQAILHEVVNGEPLLLGLARRANGSAAAGRAILVADVEAACGRAALEDARPLAMLLAAGVTSCVLAPLCMQGRPFGWLVTAIAGSSDKRYDEPERALVEDLARRAAVAIDNATLFEMTQRERARVEEANQAKDEFLAVVSHELRAPLTAILGWTALLGEGGLSPADHDRAVQTIERNARSQTQLIADLLDVSSIISGKLRLNVSLIKPATIVTAGVEAILPTAGAKGVAIESLIDAGAGTIHGDPERIQQIVWNLLTNAVKFTPKDGRVQVRVDRADASVEIRVADTGCGIPAEFLPYVFERFRQADAGITRRHGGLGLGMAITRHLVELHGGTIHVASRGQGLGATFVVRLPLAPPAAASATPDAPARAALPSRCPPEIDGLHVLIVDDEHDVSAFVASALTNCKARVSIASGVEEALESIRRDPPDVMVSDIGMPGASGYELIRKIRRLPPEQGGRTPAVALTGYARSEDRTKALTMGFDMHVSKPVEPQELLVVIARLATRLRAS